MTYLSFIVCLNTKNEEREGDIVGRYRSEVMQKAYEAGGYRERFAMENGNKSIIYVHGQKCYKFTYSKYLEYQDGNGATYNTVTGGWID